MAKITALWRREDSLNVLAKLELADQIADGHGRAKAISDAMRHAKPGGGGTIADVYTCDDPVNFPTPIADPEEARAELAKFGAAAMAEMRGDGFHEAAHEAWCEAVFGKDRKWPEMTQDGKVWALEDALADSRLEGTLSKTKHKAVGADGVDVVWLRARVGALYVLLGKPGADTRVIRERRETALYCTPLKLLLSTLLRGIGDAAQSQTLPEQMGWTEAHGAVDASILFSAMHSQAISRPGFCVILFLDLKQFFPRIPTRAVELEAAMLQRVAAREFAIMEGRYDTQLGLSDSICIDWGALMGCI
jgi:hypothetical protein